MATSIASSNLPQRVRQRAEELRRDYQRTLWKQTDRIFIILFLVQWLGGVAMAIWLSPWAWEGLSHRIHPHVWAAVVVGGIIPVCPIVLALMLPGETITRMTISVAQMLHSALLIHLSGGRIETHFHVFGSLAILSFYRDWRVLVPATIVVALDHAIRGTYWPESVFGILSASPWRWMEHAGWVVFEDVFLIWACVRGSRELSMLATRQAELEATNERIEIEVARQTARLEAVSQELLGTARRAGMAEIATGVLHNVGNVLNSVNVSASSVVQKLRESEIVSLVKVGDMLRTNQDHLAAFLTDDERGKRLPLFLIELAECLGREQDAVLAEIQRIATGLEHIRGIVGAQQRYAKEDSTVRRKVAPADLFEEAIALQLGDASDPSLQVYREFQPIPSAMLDSHRLVQILVNLLSNARHAVDAADPPAKHILLVLRVVEGPDGDRIQFEVTDNGIGIAAENMARIFGYGFTTREEGHGFGLHSCANAAREMGGTLRATSDGPSTGATFILELPLTGPAPTPPAAEPAAPYEEPVEESPAR